MSIQTDLAQSNMSNSNKKHSYNFDDEDDHIGQIKQEDSNKIVETRGRGDIPNVGNDRFYSVDSKLQANAKDSDARSVASSSSRSKSKDLFLQNQLQKSQSKLFSLAKRIDQCLVTSKTNYSDLKMQQATEVNELEIIEEHEHTENKQITRKAGNVENEQYGSSASNTPQSSNKQTVTENGPQDKTRKLQAGTDHQVLYSENNNAFNSRNAGAEEETIDRSLNQKGESNLRRNQYQSSVSNELDSDLQKQLDAISSYISGTSESMKKKDLLLSEIPSVKSQELPDESLASRVIENEQGNAKLVSPKTKNVNAGNIPSSPSGNNRLAKKVETDNKKVPSPTKPSRLAKQSENKNNTILSPEKPARVTKLLGQNTNDTASPEKPSRAGKQSERNTNNVPSPEKPARVTKLLGPNTNDTASPEKPSRAGKQIESKANDASSPEKPNGLTRQTEIKSNNVPSPEKPVRAARQTNVRSNNISSPEKTSAKPGKHNELKQSEEPEEHNINLLVSSNRSPKQNVSKYQQQTKPVTRTNKVLSRDNSKAKVSVQEAPKRSANKNQGNPAYEDNYTSERQVEVEEDEDFEDEREFNIYQQKYGREPMTQSPIRHNYEDLREDLMPEYGSSAHQSSKSSPKKSSNKKVLLSKTKDVGSKFNRNVASGSSSAQKSSGSKQNNLSPKPVGKLADKGKGSIHQRDSVDPEDVDERDQSFDSEFEKHSIEDYENYERSEGTYNNDGKSRDEVRSTHSRAISQGGIDKSYYDEEIESSFMKAYTTRKNKIINEVPNFAERMDSDIFFRRRFKNDLQKFLKEYKPKISNEQAEKLYERLVEDVKRRQLKAHKNEIESEKRSRNQREGQDDVSEEQVSQTFDRLVADARKRMFVQEEREKSKILNEKEESERLKREAKENKLSRKAEVNLVIKMMEDAGRRKIEKMKMERAKMEEEAIRAEELLRNRYKNKNNNTKSKVKEYLESQGTQVSQGEARKGRESSEKPKKASAVTSKYQQYTRKSQDAGSLELADQLTYEEIDPKDHKLKTPKTRYTNVASPKGNVNARSTENLNQESGKKGASNVEYLKNLRTNINKYKSDIEEQIQTLQHIDNPNSAQNQSRSTNAVNSSSTKGSPIKKSNKYSHIESKVAKQIEAKPVTADQLPEDISTEQDISSRYELSKRKYYKQSNTPVKAKGSEKSIQTESSEKKQKFNPNFMSDQEAMVFVDKLIHKFKAENNI